MMSALLPSVREGHLQRVRYHTYFGDRQVILNNTWAAASARAETRKTSADFITENINQDCDTKISEHFIAKIEMIVSVGNI